MSQKKEKYARNMEKRVGKLEDRVDKMDTELTAHAIRLYNIEDDLAVYNAAMSAREEKRIRAELAAKREARNEKREQERIHAKRVTLAVLFGLLAILVLIIMARAADANRAEDLAPTPHRVGDCFGGPRPGIIHSGVHARVHGVGGSAGGCAGLGVAGGRATGPWLLFPGGPHAIRIPGIYEAVLRGIRLPLPPGPGCCRLGNAWAVQYGRRGR